MKKNNNWGINFPDNPYEGQIFITLILKIPLLMSFLRINQVQENGLWLLIRTLLQTATNKSFFTIS